MTAFASAAGLEPLLAHNLEVYLRDHLRKLQPRHHPAATAAFAADVRRIAAVCAELPLSPLSADTLCQLHACLYPKGYVQTCKDEHGQDVVWMTPGVYRQIELASADSGTRPYPAAQQVAARVDAALARHNQAMAQTAAGQRTLPIVCLVLELVHIHPFGDGNGRLAGLLCDLLLWAHQEPTLGLLRSYKLNRQAFTERVAQGYDMAAARQLCAFAAAHQHMAPLDTPT